MDLGNLHSVCSPGSRCLDAALPLALGHAQAAVPGFGLTKGLVVELLPFVPASSSGRRVGSLCLVDPAELASI